MNGEPRMEDVERPAAWEGLLGEAFGPPEGDGPDAGTAIGAATSRFETDVEIARDEGSVLLLGRDREMDREVTLRVLEDDASLAPFLERAQVGAQLQHPGILPVYAFGLLEDGRAYVAERQIEGDSFADLLRREIGSPRLLRVLEQTAHALAFAHARGVAHAHVTAERIVAGPHGEVVVTGWDRAVRANGDPAPIGEDVRALGSLLSDLEGDLEPLAERCLADDPTERPRHAAEVARAIGSHLARSEERTRRRELEAARERARADEARSREASERSASRRARSARRWTFAVSTVTLLAVASGAIGLLLRRGEDRAAASRASLEVSAAMREAARHEAAGDLTEALAWARNAVALATGAPPGMRDRARETHDRLDGARRLLATLEELRAHRHGRPLSFGEADAVGSDADAAVLRQLEPEYAAAFRQAGMDVEHVPPAAAAAVLRVQRDPVELAAALEEWAALCVDQEHARRLIEVARLTDPDPWRDAVRRALLEDDSEGLRDRLATADVARLPVRTLVLLAWTLRFAGDPEAAVGLLEEAHRRVPGDPALSASLARTLRETNGASRAERTTTLRLVAMVREPDHGCLWRDLACALVRQGDARGAGAAARRSTVLEPAHADHWDVLGVTLGQQGRLEEATAAFRRAVELSPEARPRVNLGEALRRQERFAEALDAYESALDRAPASAKAHMGQGLALARLGRHEEGLAALRRATRYQPGLGIAHYNLGSWLHRLGRHAEAIPVLEKAAELLPGDADALNNLGGALAGIERFETALETLDRAVAHDPKHALAQHNRGRVLAGLGRLDEAIDAYREAVRLDPSSADAWHALGSLLHDHRRDLDGALEAFQATIRLDPDRADSRFCLGLTHESRGDLRKAEAAYREAIRCDASFGPGYRGLGEILARQEELEEARTALRRAVDLMPGDVHALNSLGAVLLLADLPEEAEGVLRRAVEIEDGLWQAHANLARVREMLGRFAEAIESYRRALRLEPRQVFVLDRLAWLLANCRDERFGEPDQAVRCARRASELAPEKASVRRTLGVALHRDGRFEEAINELDGAAALRPGDACRGLFLAMAHARLGREREAREWYEKAVEWMKANESKDEELERFRAEAEATLDGR